MCCLVKRIRKSSPPKPPPHPRHAHIRHGDSSLSSSAIASSSVTDFSTTSSSSIASIKDMLPDGPSIYRFKEICAATDNFSPDKKVGHAVWKAVLRDASVAISRKLGCTHRLSNALRKVHSLHHSNLVKLLGACKDGEHIYLVYEFVESSNLRECLRSKHSVSFSALSSWHSRLQVALDVAKGLEYLHHLTFPTLIHKYIDSRNILVSNHFRAKVAHVGVAVLTGELDFIQEKLGESDAGGEIRPHSTNEISPHSSNRRFTRSQSIKINGIQGYMPPEYIMSGQVTVEYDIFSYGVILCEILSGREAVVSGHQQARKMVPLPEMLLSIMSSDDSKSRLRQWMDPLLRDSYPLDDAFKVATIAKLCVDPDPLNRPQMSDVGWNLQKLMASAEKWEATMGAQQDILTETLQPR